MSETPKRKVFFNGNQIGEFDVNFGPEQIKSALLDIIPGIESANYDEGLYASTGNIYFYKTAKVLGN